MRLAGATEKSSDLAHLRISLEASASDADFHCLPCTGLDTIIGISSTIIET